MMDIPCDHRKWLLNTRPPLNFSLLRQNIIMPLGLCRVVKMTSIFNRRAGINLLVATLALCLNTTTAFADVCDYRPSHLLGETGSKVAIGTGGAIAGTTATGTALGMYTLVHAGSGLTMLGSTMAGASGAGTVGIIAGTSGALGAAGAIILNPFVWVPAAILGAGGGGFEAACAFLIDERITKYEDVLQILKSFEMHADPEYFNLVENAIPAFVMLTGPDDTVERYNIEDLYIVDGVLKHRDFGPNTSIGRVVLLTNKS